MALEQKNYQNVLNEKEGKLLGAFKEFKISKEKEGEKEEVKKFTAQEIADIAKKAEVDVDKYSSDKNMTCLYKNEVILDKDFRDGIQKDIGTILGNEDLFIRQKVDFIGDGIVFYGDSEGEEYAINPGIPGSDLLPSRQLKIIEKKGEKNYNIQRDLARKIDAIKRYEKIMGKNLEKKPVDDIEITQVESNASKDTVDFLFKPFTKDYRDETKKLEKGAATRKAIANK